MLLGLRMATRPAEVIQSQRCACRAIDDLFIELFAMLMMPMSPKPFGDRLADQEQRQKAERKTDSQTVATFLVNRFTTAVLSRMRKMIVDADGQIDREIGIGSLAVDADISAVLHTTRCALFLKRRMTMASVLKTNDQTTPNGVSFAEGIKHRQGWPRW